MQHFSVEQPEPFESKGVHPTAVIHPSAKIDPSAEIGPYAVIGEGVRVGPQTRIGSHAVIEFAEIGASCQIHSHAFVGTAPQDLKYRGEKTKIVVGDGTIVRECATLNRGTTASGKTEIGRKCLIMAYAHVAHDCVIEDEVILANSVAVAGHVKIGMGTIVGGLSGIHQFVQVGRLAMIGAGGMVAQDVPPFCTVWGDRAKIVGLNLEGLRRRHFSPAAIESLKKTYRSLFFSKKTLQQTLTQLLGSKSLSEESREFAGFIRASARGVCRPRQKAETGASETW
jgi:UDP-N-acetylglucosamine acyltransferase